VFRCKITGGHLAINDEATSFHWANQSDVQHLMSGAYAIRVLDALRSDPTAPVRTHDGVRVLVEPTDRA
jgi:8-oxo-dGTP diphosphatase